MIQILVQVLCFWILSTILSLSKNVDLFRRLDSVSVMIASNLVEIGIMYFRIQIYNVECYLGLVEFHASTG
jgi:hypothetical protein